MVVGEEDGLHVGQPDRAQQLALGALAAVEEQAVAAAAHERGGQAAAGGRHRAGGAGEEEREVHARGSRVPPAPRVPAPTGPLDSFAPMPRTPGDPQGVPRVHPARQRRRPRRRGGHRGGVHGRGQRARQGPPHADHRGDLRQARLQQPRLHHQRQPLRLRRLPQRRADLRPRGGGALLLRRQARELPHGAPAHRARRGVDDARLPAVPQRDPDRRVALRVLHVRGARRRCSAVARWLATDACRVVEPEAKQVDTRPRGAPRRRRSHAASARTDATRAC